MTIKLALNISLLRLSIFSQFSLVTDSVFANSPSCYNLILIPTSIAVVLSWSIHGCGKSGRKCESPTVLVLRLNKAMLCLPASARILQTRSFMQSIQCHVFHTFMLYVWDSAVLKWAPKYSDKVLSSVPKYNKAVMCLMEMVPMPYKTHSGMSSMLINNNLISNKVSLNRNIDKARLCTDWLMKMSGPKASRNLTLYFLWKQWFRIHQFSVHSSFTEHNYCE